MSPGYTTATGNPRFWLADRCLFKVCTGGKKLNKMSTFTARVLLPVTFLWINRTSPWHLTQAAHFTSPTINIHNNLIRGLNGLTAVFLKLVPASGLQSPPTQTHTHTHTHTHLQSINTGVFTYFLLTFLSLSLFPSFEFLLHLSVNFSAELSSIYLLYPPFCKTL